MSDTVRLVRDRRRIDLDLITRLGVPGTGTLLLVTPNLVAAVH